jgi:peptidyl-prolyl cis-trans isomerase C
MVDEILKDFAAHGQQVDDNTRSLVVDHLIANEVVLQEAQRQGIDKQPDLKIREEIQTRELIVNAFLQDYIKKNPIDDAEVKAEYEKFKVQWGDKEYKASHILVKTEQEAKDIIAQLANNGDFVKIAKDKSLDSSKDKGGALDWLPPGRMVKPFADAVVKLQKGLYTTVPVQTQFGWHVIKLDDVRSAPPPAYDTVKDALRNNLQKQQLEKLVADLRAKAKIVDNSSAAKAKK